MALEAVVRTQIGLCFTDSKVALFWVQGESKEWKQFVHNRVTEIRKLVPVPHWSHCPGKDNPADLPSCGIFPRELECNQVWLQGPQWLPKMSLKQQRKEIDMPAECAAELKGKDSVISQSNYWHSDQLPAIQQASEATEGNSICTQVCHVF